MNLNINSDKPFTVVTNAAGNIGYELSKLYALHGHDLLVVSENPGVVEVLQVFNKFGVDVEYIICNLTIEGPCDEFVSKLSKIEKSIDVIVVIENEYLLIQVAQMMSERHHGSLYFLSSMKDSQISEDYILDSIDAGVNLVELKYDDLANAAFEAQNIFAQMNMIHSLPMIDLNDSVKQLSDPVKLKH
jgi:hypothetical protein